MIQLRSILTILFLSFCLFGSIAFSNDVSVVSLAAITPPEAQNIINNSDSAQEAGQRLKSSDSFEKVRDRKALNTAEEVTDRFEANQSDRRDPLVSHTQNKLEEFAENVKEKLNLDEPIPQSTKDFGNDLKSKANETLGRSKGEPGYYQNPQ
ncbi:hypothetical protein [Myxacorys almedinensis]|uniref:Uncharacterized protein n=1 Tax=Myxacorys almedinensis A TaxID=2690445 RepID=A0A8J8CM98_9CYAN|nr:hypothetical protein [Myxacorys almedinensis]NDJ18500.1 hypothetical protein [Myxacorys almedinensis A]